MKKFGLVVASLYLMGASAGAGEVATPTPPLPMQTMRITTGEIVATLQVPVSLADTKNKMTVEAQSMSYDSNKNLCTSIGHAVFQISRDGQTVLKITADQITMQLKAKQSASLTANGKVIVQAQQDGKMMQIMADSLVLGPQSTK